MAIFKSIFGKFKTWTTAGKRCAFRNHTLVTDDPDVIAHLRALRGKARGKPVVYEIPEEHSVADKHAEAATPTPPPDGMENPAVGRRGRPRLEEAKA